MPALMISKSQMDKLGVRLRDHPSPDAADVELYEEVVAAYEDALQLVVACLGMLGFAPTSRAKVLGTVIKKLRRQRSCGLSSVQDLVGARVVLEGDLDAQDSAVERFRGALPLRKVIDRRSTYLAYRAAHDNAANRLRRRLDEMADRVELTRRVP